MKYPVTIPERRLGSRGQRFWRGATLLLALTLLLAGLPAAVHAQPGAPGLTLRLRAERGGVLVRWRTVADTAAPPIQTITLQLGPGPSAAPQLRALDTAPWSGSLLALGPANATPPEAPLTLLREERLRGRRLGVYLLSPLYISGGGPAVAASGTAYIAEARLFGAAELRAALADPTPFLSGVPAPDPRAAQPGWLISVTQVGMQRLSAAALRAAGLDLGALDADRLTLFHAGQPVALELLRSSGVVTELRFYAPAPESRWSATAPYWLTLGTAPGLRMVQRVTAPGGAPASTTAMARGTWRSPTSYEARLPGPDGDHFFAFDMRVAPTVAGQPAEPAIAQAPLALPLPPAAGALSLRVVGASLFAGPHTLDVRLGQTTRSSSWQGAADWSFDVMFPTFGPTATLTLRQQQDADSLHVDVVSWEAPVTLRFGGRGAFFFGRPGSWAYQLRELPAGAALYDLRDPQRPQRLSLTSGAFGDSDASPHPYLLAGPGTMVEPPITRRVVRDLRTPLDADVLYIAPHVFLDPLKPLLAQRRAQGHRVATVATEAIYDGWSAGAVDPAAIRSFLRYAAATWQRAPSTVVLVGDGTNDPRNYQGIGQTSWLPPYLLPVERWNGWISETACEICFAQLDGDDPLGDLLPDMTVGRLPVKSAAELAALVQKLLRYEQNSAVAAWRGRVAYIADNSEAASDFTAVADASAAALPAGVAVERVYYDPAPPPGQPWRERDPLRALDRTLDLFNIGATVLVYIGHGLPYQWAVTGPPLQSGPNVPQDRRYLLNVDFAGDVRNGTQLPVVLSMTCLTSAFQTPSRRGTTIDEALLLNSAGGAIATWGSSGLNVLSGHEALLGGFVGVLAKQPSTRLTVGELVMAGHLKLAASSASAEAGRTFILLGDPLSPVRLTPGIRTTQLPLVQR